MTTIGDGSLFSYGIDNKKSLERKMSFPDTLDSPVSGEPTNQRAQILQAAECLDLSFKS